MGDDVAARIGDRHLPSRGVIVSSPVCPPGVIEGVVLDAVIGGIILCRRFPVGVLERRVDHVCDRIVCKERIPCIIEPDPVVGLIDEIVMNSIVVRIRVRDDTVLRILDPVVPDDGVIRRDTQVPDPDTCRIRGRAVPRLVMPPAVTDDEPVEDTPVRPEGKDVPQFIESIVRVAAYLRPPDAGQGDTGSDFMVTGVVAGIDEDRVAVHRGGKGTGDGRVVCGRHRDVAVVIVDGNHLRRPFERSEGADGVRRVYGRIICPLCITLVIPGGVPRESREGECGHGGRIVPRRPHGTQKPLVRPVADAVVRLHTVSDLPVYGGTLCCDIAHRDTGDRRGEDRGRTGWHERVDVRVHNRSFRLGYHVWCVADTVSIGVTPVIVTVVVAPPEGLVIPGICGGEPIALICRICSPFGGLRGKEFR